MWIELTEWAKENLSFEMSHAQLARLAKNGQLYPSRKISGKWRCTDDAQLLVDDQPIDTNGMSKRAQEIWKDGAPKKEW